MQFGVQRLSLLLVRERLLKYQLPAFFFICMLMFLLHYTFIAMGTPVELWKCSNIHTAPWGSLFCRPGCLTPVHQQLGIFLISVK